MCDNNLIFITDQSLTSTIDITTSTSYTLPQTSKGFLDIGSKVEKSTSTSSNVIVTTMYNQSQTDSVLFTSPDIAYPVVTKSLLTNSVQKVLSTLSAMNTTSVTHSTSPHLTYNSDNDNGT